MDDGSTVSEVSPGLVNNIPSLRQYTMTFAVADLSNTYIFYMVADNIIGSI